MTTSSPNSIAAAMTRLKNAGEPESVAQFVHQNKEVAATASKLRSDPLPPQHDAEGNRKITEPGIYSLRNISDAISQKDSDSETTLQLFPEIQNAADILISSIKSPQDMFNEEANFTVTDGLTVQPVIATLLPMVKDYFTTRLNIMDKFTKILQQTLLYSGSMPVVVIPENSLDDLINGSASISKETLSEYLGETGFRNVGYLGAPDSPTLTAKSVLSIERYTSIKTPTAGITNKINANASEDKVLATNNKILEALNFVSVTDNPNAMKLSKLNARIARENMEYMRHKTVGAKNSLHQSAESLKAGSPKMSDRDLTQLLYSKTRTRQQTFVKAKSDNQLNRYSVGEALIMDLPPESFVPVVQPGMPDEPIGGFILLDGEGHPLSRKTQRSHFDSMRRNFQMASTNYTNGEDLSSSLLRQAKHNLGGSCENPTFDQASRVWADIVEADLLARLRNGIFGKDITLSSMQSFYRMMLARAMAGQFTQVIFVPKDMMTYFTYKLNDDGTGKSLLEDTRILSAMRAQLLIAKVQGIVKNSIGRRRVRVTLPEGDANPQHTIDLVRSEILRQCSLTTPVSSINPVDVVSQVQGMSIEFEFEGGTLPDVKIEFEEVQSNYQLPDDSLEEILKNRVIQGLSVPPELVDEASQAEFATIAISNHLLFAKKVREFQRKFIPQLSSFCRQVLRADPEFIISVKKIMVENYSKIIEREGVDPDIVKYKDSQNFVVDMLVQEFISNVDIELASPDVKSLENLVESLEKYEAVVDKGIEYVFSEEATSAALLGDQAFEQVDMIRKAAKAALMRREMQRIGLASEVFDIIATNEEGGRVFDLATELQSHNTTMSLIIKEVLEKVKTIAQAGNIEIPKSVVSEDTGSSSSFEEPAPGGDGMFDDGGGAGGFDDFDGGNLSDDLSGSL